MTDDETVLAMFPLGSAVLPTQIVPLHVFEPRYRALVEDIADNDPPSFGIALIDRGHEVGGGDHRVDVATRVEVLQTEEFDDGRYAVIAAGVERIDVLEWLDDDPYPRARVRPRRRVDDGGGSLDDLEALVRGVITLALGEDGSPEIEFSGDPLVRLDQMSAVAPISTFDRQRVLETATTSEQIRVLTEALVDRRDVLAVLGDDVPPDADSGPLT